MISLINKDFTLIKKNLLFAILYLIAFPILIYFDRDNKYYLINIFVPFFSQVFIIGKMCHIEDGLEIKKFIKILPIKSSLIVLTKYVETICILIVCQIYGIIIDLIVYKSVAVSLILKANLVIFLGTFIYGICYLIVYYFKGYFIAQNSFLIFFILIFLIDSLLKKSNIKIESLVNKSDNILIIAVLVTVAIIYIGYHTCIKLIDREKYTV